MGLPNFLCIGAQKAGTSWLNNVLLEHPKIFMPPINELHFFDRLGNPQPALRPRQLKLAERAIKGELAKGDKADDDYIRYLLNATNFPSANLDWYKAIYSWPVAAGVKTGDITPAYLEIDEQYVRFARELLGPAKIILVVRRPLDRLLSQLRMWASRSTRAGVPQNENEWMELLNEVTRKAWRGSYSTGIPRWLKHFGREHLLVLPYGQMKTDPRAMISEIEDHIEVPRFNGYQLLTTEIHVTKKLDIPTNVIAAAAALIENEDKYLVGAFGHEFFVKTR